MLGGVTIPNNSFVDIDDVVTIGYGTRPSNGNSNSLRALLCITDLVDCCAAPHTVRGDWYFPNGQVVVNTPDIHDGIFRINRGPNEEINGQITYGSIRLWRRWSIAPGRGHFRCELPSAADPSVNQTIYANICEHHFLCLMYLILYQVPYSSELRIPF